MLKYITFIFALFASVEASAQNAETQPLMQQPEQIADTLLQSDITPRAEMTGEEMLVPDSMTRYALPMLHFSAPGFNGFSPWNYGAMPVWQMHEGFNAQLGLSLTAGFGKGAPHGVGFSQQAAFGYAMPLSKRFAVAAGIYANNMDWGGFQRPRSRSGGSRAIPRERCRKRVCLRCQIVLPERPKPTTPL